MCAEPIGSYHTRSMIHGLPEPSLFGFLPHQTPHFVDFSFVHLLALNDDRTWIPVLNCRGLDVLELRLVL